MERFTGPHDYFDQDYVDEWAEIANTRRPHRARFFEAFVTELSRLDRPDVLDLGAGPGFLAEQALTRCDVSSYHLLDFSPRMIELARDRLARFGGRAFFHQADFLEDGWWRTLPQGFDAVVSLQAVHEVRDAEKIAELYSGVAMIVAEGGKIIVADKLDFVTEEGTGHLTIEDHRRALERAGFSEFRRVLEVEDIIMFEATRDGALLHGREL
ncbi:MAG TPA: class I SAM-dependent methyltransferase [Blastocatellia bacterium]|nr:class I SAM-dependent methyltransferase [Blastocatellia bacterium]